MISANLLFCFFSFFLVFSACMTVFSAHPVFSLLFLVSSFLFSSFLLMFLECEFLALLFIVVYVGAIAVFFLFSIMMLEFKLYNLAKNLMKYIPVGLVFGLILFLPLLQQVSSQFVTNDGFFDSFVYNKRINWLDLVDSVTDVEIYGQILYSYFILQFLLVGLILLVVLIGVVYLININYHKQVNNQVLFKQLSRSFTLN